MDARVRGREGARDLNLTKSSLQPSSAPRLLITLNTARRTSNTALMALTTGSNIVMETSNPVLNCMFLQLTS